VKRFERPAPNFRFQSELFPEFLDSNINYMKKRMEQFKGMRSGELTKKLADLQEEIRVLRFKSEGAKSKNVKESAALKKDIARVMTLIKQEAN